MNKLNFSKNVNDIIGQLFGRLTVIEQDLSKDIKYNYYYLCKCNCGNTISTSKSALKSGRSKSCGCYKKELNHRFIDLTNQKFGKWIIISINEEKKLDRGYYWNCKCECGNIGTISSNSLRRKQSTQCRVCSNKEMGKGRILPKFITYTTIVWGRTKNNAKIRNIDFSITKEDVSNFIFDNCFYCNTKTKKNGIDRIDSTKGYTIDNVVPCCYICNYAKNDYSIEEFSNYLDGIHSQIKKPSELIKEKLNLLKNNLEAA